MPSAAAASIHCENSHARCQRCAAGPTGPTSQGIFRYWIVAVPEGGEWARIQACPGGEPPQRRPVKFQQGADGTTTATLVLLAACLAIIVSEAEPRHAVYPVPTC